MSVQRFNKAHSSTQPYHIYYDMNVINNDASFPSRPVRFQYKETRSNAYLLSPQDYYMSIVRFNLQTPTLPVFIPQINLNPDTNKGGTFPISRMGFQPSANVPFFVSLYNNVSFPTGTIVYLANNNLNPTINDLAGTAQQYYRVTNVEKFLSGGSTVLTLQNNTATGNPSLYEGSSDFLKGGTQTLSYAQLNITNLVYNPSTSEITFNYPSIGSLGPTLTLFVAGDLFYINNSGQYNGRYSIKSVDGATNTIVTFAPQLRGLNLQPYIGGGFLLPTGEYYNVTPYTITMEYTSLITSTTYTYSQSVIFQPNDLTQPPPQWNPSNPLALNLQDITSEYYWVYIYENLINIINQALKNCFWGLNGLRYASSGGSLPMTGSLPTNYQPPFMSWDSQNDKANITADNTAFGQVSGGALKPTILLYFNQPLSTLFDAFPYQYPNVPAESPRYSYIQFSTSQGAGYFIVQDYTVFPPSTTNGYMGIQVYQDHQTASLMNPIQSIVFTSTILPVVMENVGQPSILSGASVNQQTVGSSANIFPIVTDFIVPFSATNQYVPDISYVPSGEYRLVDLYGESPANQIDIQVYWKDQYGVLHPFLLGSGCSGSLKVMFRRKDFNNVFADGE